MILEHNIRWAFIEIHFLKFAIILNSYEDTHSSNQCHLNLMSNIKNEV